MKLRRDWGPRASFVVTLPRDKIALLEWQQGDNLSVDCDGKKLVITNVTRRAQGKTAQ